MRLVSELIPWHSGRHHIDPSKFTIISVVWEGGCGCTVGTVLYTQSERRSFVPHFLELIYNEIGECRQMENDVTASVYE